MASSVNAVASVHWPDSVELSSSRGREAGGSTTNIDNTINGVTRTTTRGGWDSLKLIPSRTVNKLIFILVIILFLISITFITIGVTTNRASNYDAMTGIDTTSISSWTIHPSGSPTSNPSITPSLAPSSEFDTALNLIFRDQLILGEEAAIFIPGTAQWNAKRWVARRNMVALDPTDEMYEQKLIQKYALSVVAFSMSENERVVDVDWMEVDECDSRSTSCDDNGIIRALEIGKKNEHAYQYILMNFQMLIIHLAIFALYKTISLLEELYLTRLAYYRVSRIW